MRAVLVANTDWYLWNFRRALVKGLQRNGWDVILVAPDGPHLQRLREEGLDCREIRLTRRGLNLWQEFRTLMQLTKLYRELSPDVVHHFTVKCVLYGSIAAKLARGPKILNAITGLGHVFLRPGLSGALLRPIAHILYRALLRHTHIIFQNPDDAKEFKARRLVSGATSVSIIRGSGVDVDRFCPGSGISGRVERIVLMVARLTREKGVSEFADAARYLREKGCTARFVLVGAADPGNPSSLTLDELQQITRFGAVELVGPQSNMLEWYQQADICCLPSWREGVPKSLLEAAACGLPLVATDVPGCREVVHHGINGYLVNKGNSKALGDAILCLLNNDDRRAAMGVASRQMVCREFSDGRVISETLKVYKSSFVTNP